MGDVKNLRQNEAIDKLKELAEKIRVCMFCTKLGSPTISTRPMTITSVDEDGKLWFLSSGDSNKNEEISKDERVQLIFADPGSSQFVSIYGEADILTDDKSIETAWTPLAKAWYPGGKDDIFVTAIKVHPIEAHYWDTKNGKMISLIKMAAAAITGKAMDPDNGVEGELQVEPLKVPVG